MRRDKMSSSRHGDAQTGADARPDRTGPRSVGPMKLVPSLVIALLLFLAGAPGVGVSPARSHEAPPAKETVIRPGETLERALAKVGVSRAEARNVVRALGSHLNMRHLRPGERIGVTRSQNGTLARLTYWRSPLERYEAHPERDGWRVRRVLTPVQTKVAAVSATVRGSLFASMERFENGQLLAAKFVNLFEWDFDFAADSLPGDQFRLRVEKRYAHGSFIEYGSILVAQYRSAGRQALTAIRFPVAAGEWAYFDAAGRSVRKMFLRAPLDFTRITSGFSHARVHPILGGVRPHLAIDYAAPAGTAVRAVADGVVLSAGWDEGNGLSVTLRHARGYRTMYNHLSKLNVRRGQRVHQRQIIGRVGSTGLATGPHLDYRIMKDGRFVNPLNERFVPGEPVPRSRRVAFQRYLSRFLKQLDLEAPFAAQEPSR
ncbi:MAG TPA: M23 family metallopeptidase [Methylomirabilota bacterium]|nr:M23 family metallopeptidase [Methylomirabilota bacterium]